MRRLKDLHLDARLAPPERLTIGKYPTISLATARDAAKTFLAKKQLGHHASPTLPFPDAVQLFLDQQTHLKPSTKGDYERILKSGLNPSSSATC